MAQKIGKFFTLESQHSHLLLAIKNGADVPGAFVVTMEPSALATKRKDSQLWFYDHATNTIRSRLNKFCIDVDSGKWNNYKYIINRKCCIEKSDDQNILNPGGTTVLVSV